MERETNFFFQSNWMVNPAPLFSCFLFYFFPQFFGLVAVYQPNLHVPINPPASRPGTGFWILFGAVRDSRIFWFFESSN
jgi:hypothetical protein